MIGSRLHNLVSKQAERTPDSYALVFGDNRLSYEALELKSNRLARLLVASGCAKGDRVCLFVPKKIDSIVGMLGVLKAGGIYVPVDLESPAARVQRIFDACQPTHVLLAPEGAQLLDEIFGQTDRIPHVVTTTPARHSEIRVQASANFSDLDDYSAESFDVGGADTDPAHILFTSGSTGVPKGVVITHRNVACFLEWASAYFDISAGEQISGHPPLHFDLSTFDIFGTLACGATLNLVPPQLSLMAPKLAEWIRQSHIDQWFSVPSILTYMANFDVVRQHDFPAMKRLIWCGEVLPTPTLIYWMERLPHVTFTNLYGPTETTIASSYYTVESCPDDEQEDIPIGTACDGEDLLLLDENLEPTPANEIGNLYIRGVGLSPGYWKDAGTTSAVFLPYPDSDKQTDRIYKTGDLGRQDDNGLYWYVGRSDSQIKSRGHRIELGEIESALNALGCLGECAAVGVKTLGFEGVIICCAYVTSAEADVSPVSLRKDLSELLPRYMLPARWKTFDSLPKNANGKIDRNKIREIFEIELNEGQE